MSAVDWSNLPEPWRTKGGEFVAMLPALCGDPIPPPAPRQMLVGLIAEQRKKLGLSQLELARRIGCNVSTIRDYEHSRYRPSKAVRERLAAILMPEPPPPNPDLHDTLPAREAAATQR